MDYNILGSIFGSPFLGKLPLEALWEKVWALPAKAWGGLQHTNMVKAERCC